MEKNFASEYLASLGFDRGWPLNDSARLPAVLSCSEIAHIIVYDRCEPWPPGSANDDRQWRLQEQAQRVSDCLANACRRGLLKAKIPLAEHHSQGGWDYKGFLVHFDDARRYFSALDLFPPDGSALATWLRGPDTSVSGLSISAQDCADFQQLCSDQWVRNPTQPITGEGGVVAAVGASYLRKYTRGTLEKWARAVAPAGVRGKRGRPRKSDDTGK